MFGKLFGGGSRTQTTTSTTAPWAPQADQLRTAFTEAQRLYNDAQASPGYSGDFVAQANDTQRRALDMLLGASGNFGTLGSTFMGTGNELLGSYGGASSVANRLASGDAMARRVGNLALQDPTQGILATANEYANNPYLDGVINAASRDVVRNLNEQALPSLNLAASASGNMNSSRAGAAEAVLTRGAQDRIADIGATIRGDAFQNGLGMAQQQRQQGLATALAASGQNLGTIAQGGQMLSGLGGAGAGLAASGADMSLRPGQITAGVGDALQGFDQQRIENDMARFNYDDTRGWENLSRYYGIVGANNWGGESTQTTKMPRPSGLQTALGIASLAAAPFTGGASLGGTLASSGISALGSMFSRPRALNPLPMTGGISQNPFGF